jgi:hypothetical protein
MAERDWSSLEEMAAEAPISMATRFVFVRSNEAVLANSVHRGR